MLTDEPAPQEQVNDILTRQNTNCAKIVAAQDHLKRIETYQQKHEQVLATFDHNIQRAKDELNDVQEAIRDTQEQHETTKATIQKERQEAKQANMDKVEENVTVVRNQIPNRIRFRHIRYTDVNDLFD